MVVNFSAFYHLLQIKQVWNCSIRTAALQIYDGLNFTAFLRPLQKGEFRTFLFVPPLQLYNGGEFTTIQHLLQMR